MQVSTPDATQDPFAGTAAPAADPFAGAPAEATQPPAEEPGQDASPEIPTVDREGAVVETPATPAEVAADEATPAAEEAAAEAATEAEAAVALPEAPEEPQTATDGGQEPPSSPPAAPAEAPEAAAEAETPAEAAATASEDATETEAATAPAPTTSGASEGATGPRGGKGELRQYKLLYQTGEAQWTQFPLDPSAEGQSEFVKLVDGEPWMMARNNDHAKRIAFQLLGRPAQGVFLFPVPKGAWKPSRVKPAPPRPERERLVIE